MIIFMAVIVVVVLVLVFFMVFVMIVIMIMMVLVMIGILVIRTELAGYMGIVAGFGFSDSLRSRDPLPDRRVSLLRFFFLRLGSIRLGFRLAGVRTLPSFAQVRLGKFCLWKV